MQSASAPWCRSLGTCYVISCWRVCCRNFQRGHSLYTLGVVDMRTALCNYSPFLINSPVSAETYSGSMRGTCINAQQEQWLLLQSQKDPSLLCGEAVEPNMHFLLGLSQSHRLSPSIPAVHNISPVPHRAERWQEVEGCSFKHCSVVPPDCMALVCRFYVPEARWSCRQFWEVLWYLGDPSLSAANGGKANSVRSSYLSKRSLGSGTFIWLPIVTKGTQEE